MGHVFNPSTLVKVMLENYLICGSQRLGTSSGPVPAQFLDVRLHAMLTEEPGMVDMAMVLALVMGARSLGSYLSI